MTKERQIELMISMHRKIDVRGMSDAEWNSYQQERYEMEQELKKLQKRH